MSENNKMKLFEYAVVHHPKETLDAQGNETQGPDKLLKEPTHILAIGAYFHETSTPINTQAIDEIAAYNDSFPTLSARSRWRKVKAWLSFQVRMLEARKT